MLRDLLQMRAITRDGRQLGSALEADGDALALHLLRRERDHVASRFVQLEQPGGGGALGKERTEARDDFRGTVRVADGASRSLPSALYVGWILGEHPQ